jgi:hypothetical protein
MHNQSVEFRAGGGLLLTLFGLPFLLGGLGVIYAGFNGSIQMESGGPAPIYFYLPFGGIFATVGALISFGRAGKRLDPARRQVIEWWGFLFVPLRQTVRDWDDFREVVLRKEIIRSKNSSRTVFRVYLEGDGEPLMVDSVETFLESRRQGEKAAKCIKLPLRDKASGSDTVRQPDELDISLRDQMLKEGRELELTAPPTDSRSSYTMDEQKVVFELPPTGFQIPHILRIGFSAFVFVIVTVFFVAPMSRDFSGAPAFVKVVMLVIFCLFLLPLLGGIFNGVKGALSRRRVTLDQQALEVDIRSPLGGSVQKIPLQQLEELELVHGGLALEARSDDVVVRLGEGLKVQEVLWLKNTIEYILLKM